MAKKDFSSTISGVDAFFSGTAAEPMATVEEPKVVAPVQAYVPQSEATQEERSVGKHARETYVFTLHLPKQWKEILSDAAWERRMSVTGLLVQILGDWLKAQRKI